MQPLDLVNTSILPAEQGSLREDARAQTRRLIGILKRRWPVVAAALLLSISCAIIFVALAQKEYTASADLLITPRQSRVADLDNPDMPTNTESTFVDNQVEILQSAALVGRLVDKLDLASDYEFVPERRGDGRSLSTLWGLIGSPDRSEAGSKADAAARDMESRYRVSAIQALQKAITVKRARLTYVVRVSVTTQSAEKSAMIANALAELYLVDQLDSRVEVNKRTTKWLDEQLRSLRENLTASERAAETYKAQNNLTGGLGNTLNDQQRADINAQLTIARADLAAKEARYRRVASLGESGGDIQTVGEVLQSDVIASLRKQQAELMRQQAELSNRYDDKHPTMVNSRAQLRDIDMQIQAEARRIAANLQNEVIVARSRTGSLAGTLGSLESRTMRSDMASVRLRELEREASSNRELYENLLESSKKALVLSNNESLDPVARRIADAVVPTTASFPKPALSLAVATLLGLLGAAVVIALLEVLDRGFRSTDVAEQHLGMSPLATIPLVKSSALKEAESTDVFEYLTARPISAFAEALRKLRSAIGFSNIDLPPKVIMITSSLPGEGKTAVSCSLAKSMAMSGFRTLLIDCDLRRPSVAKQLDLTSETDLIDVLSGSTPLKDAIISRSGGKLDVLITRRPTVNSADIVDSRAMSDLLAAAKKSYDYVIVDSAPVIPLVDPSLLARRVDAIAFVIRWEKSPRDACMLALRKLIEAEGRVAGFVLNGVDVEKMARTSMAHGDEYYYYGRYSGYYDSEDKTIEEAA